jgi:glycolate oxidase
MSQSHSEWLEGLIRKLGADNVLTAPEDILPYGFDGTAALKRRPLAVAFAHDATQVSAVLRLARAHRVPVVTRGSGTGLSGGSVPVANSLVLCLAKMDRILEVDTANLTRTWPDCFIRRTLAR